MKAMIIFLLLAFLQCQTVSAQNTADSAVGKHTVSGNFYDAKSKEPLAFAVIATENNKIWTSADKDGHFILRNVNSGERVFNIYLMGYVDRSIRINVSRDIDDLHLYLEPVSLQLEQVLITAEHKDKKSNSSSSYTVDRTAMDHLQATNITDVMSLLPGGKFRGDLNLTNSQSTFEVRGEGGEMNSTSFSTAVEVDGVRLSNNADFGKLKGIDNRTIPVTNVESVEIVTGIPSVEYGDLNSGLVKIRTAKGRTPYVLEFVTRPNTKMYSARKGFNIGNATLNASLERAKSISNLISPHTSYVRNGLTLHYSQRLTGNYHAPLFLSAGFSGNIGGYDSKLDPDQVGDSYVKDQDHSFRTNLGLTWAPGTRVLSNLEWSASLSYSAKLTTQNELNSYSGSSVAVHAMEDGYNVAQDYDENPHADVILIKPGQWYELGYFQDKPLYFNTKIKADSKNNYGERVFNHVMLGAEYSYAHNKGRGEYYNDMRFAPTWREYLLYEKPAMNNLSVFLEDNLNIRTTDCSHLQFTAGIRSDITFIKGSEYGTVAAFSPRFNLKYIFWENRPQTVSDLKIHVGWGKAVKLPSFNILYPQPNYLDLSTFVAPSDAKNISYRAYRTVVNTPVYNKDLRWQSNRQLEAGAEATVAGFHFNVLFYRNQIRDTYSRQQRYRPYSYKYTGPSALEGIPIVSANRAYKVDKHTGIVTVSDKTGEFPDQVLDYITYNRYISNSQYVNGSPVERMGVEYSIDFPKIKAIHTQLRLDGNFYRYEGVDQVMSQDYPGMYTSMSDGRPYKYMGHYVGRPSAANGSITKEKNLNVMLTTHIPKIRFIVSLRLESTLMDWSQNLSRSPKGNRSYVLDDADSFIGTDPDIYNRNKFVVTYPLYYSTWEEPEKMIPFMEKFLWAREHDRNLFNDLSRLVQKSNYSFIFDRRKISPYYSISINLTKEFGDIASVSFYSTNFLNNMQKIRSNWGTIEESCIYEKGYIAGFYYGLSIRLKF